MNWIGAWTFEWKKELLDALGGPRSPFPLTELEQAMTWEPIPSSLQPGQQRHTAWSPYSSRYISYVWPPDLTAAQYRESAA